ncbi:hypothetical protein [Microbacterium sp. SORGH_AS_0888]|uniref:DUF7937 domain-containing protein n=1 Tax=Microbacterium sp. SORGH_AS_0888 TaxID=3041791 RepID=UPI002780B572|nr:hypothetical protein [Microbacterium sp. SORGH_AS_0888]MDQ1129168.1 hypothetical protein [Microbacterium sp. SORGH_AS_0888]
MTYDPSAYPPAQPTGAYPPPQPTGAYPAGGYPQPTGAYPAGGGYPQPTTWEAPAASAPAPAQPRPNPLATMPVSDWVRDGAALVLLLVSLAMPWSLRFTIGSYDGGYVAVGATRIEVVLITVLSVLSLAVTYLARFGALGAGMTTGRTAALRAALNAPYALLILVYVVLDAAKVGDLGTGVGLGAGATLGLAGALFAASPRAHEVGAADRRWPIVRAAYTGTAVFLGVVALTVLIGLILLSVALSGLMLSYGQYTSLADGLGAPSAPTGVLIAVGFAGVVAFDAAVLVPAVFVLRRSPSAPRIAAAVGIAVLVATVIASFTGFSLGMGIVSLSQGGYVFLWLGAFAAVMTSPALLAGMRPQAPLTTWFVAARQTLVVTVVVSGVLAVFAVAALVVGGSVGFFIGILLCQVVSAVGALIGRVQLVSAPERSRTVVLSIVGGIAAVQLVALILAGVSQGGSSMIGFLSIVPVTYLVAVGLPAFVAYALTVPRDVRAYYAAHAPKRPTAYAAPQGYAPQTYPPAGAPQTAGYPEPQQAYAQQPTPAAPQQYAPPAAEPPAYAPAAPTYAPAAPEVPAYAPAAPEVPAYAPAAPPVREEARRAADPSTPAEELYGYTSDPALWPALAANPALYPELVSWLAATGDPQVLAALRARGA